MNTKPLKNRLTVVAGLVLAGAFSPLGLLGFAQSDSDGKDLLKKDLEGALKAQMERFSRLLKDDPEGRQQFEKGLEEMLRAFEEGKSRPGEPRHFEFRWEGDASDLPELENLAPDFGDLFDGFDPGFGSLRNRGFNPFEGGDPFGGDLLQQFRDRLGRGSGPGFPGFEVEPQEIPELSKNHPDELRKFQSIVTDARESTLRILSGGVQIALGTIISESGYALTKGSELARAGRVLEAELSDGRSGTATVVENIPDYDLALIKVEAEGLTPVQFSESVLPIGSFLAAPGTGEIPIAIGVVSVLPRNLSEKRKGYLGIAVETADQGVRIGGVSRDSAAAEAGLMPGDIITAFDGQPVSSSSQLINSVSGRDPDASVQITFLRDGRRAVAEARLRSREEVPDYLRRSNRSLDLTRRMGAVVSSQSGGYPEALQHDLPLVANQIGGPLVNLEGDVVGINIARAGRVSTYALTAKTLNTILSSLSLDDRPKREETPGTPEIHTDPIAFREEIDEAERAIEEAREALRRAEERARAARERFRGGRSPR